MTTERTYRDMKWTPEQKAERKAVREYFQRVRPGLDDIRSSNEYVGPIPQGLFLEILVAIRNLRNRREALGLSLVDVARKVGIDITALENLEKGIPNETPIETLYRYAHALGNELSLVVIEPSPGSAPQNPEPA